MRGVLRAGGAVDGTGVSTADECGMAVCLHGRDAEPVLVGGGVAAGVGGDAGGEGAETAGFDSAFGVYDIVGNVDEWVAASGKGRDRFHLFHATANESDWLSEKFVRNGLGFRVAV